MRPRLKEVAATWERVQVARGSLTATFDHLKRHFSNERSAEAAVKQRMKSNLHDYLQMVCDQVLSAEHQGLYIVFGDGVETRH